jgi:hypothetical protein
VRRQIGLVKFGLVPRWVGHADYKYMDWILTKVVAIVGSANNATVNLTIAVAMMNGSAVNMVTAGEVLFTWIRELVVDPTAIK